MDLNYLYQTLYSFYNLDDKYIDCIPFGHLGLDNYRKVPYKK